jgi:hypothetical protein
MKRTFYYIHNETTVKFEYEISEYTYKKYNGYWKVFPRGLIYFVPWIKRLVTISRKCPDIQKIIFSIEQVTKGWTKEDRLELILKFCRSSIYQSDKTLYKLFDYWATAQETLYLGKGDCEDSAILINTLLIAFGYDSKFVLMKDHMACAIYGNYTGYYIQSGSKKYYYIESTSHKPIGEISENNKEKTKVLLNAK